VNQAADGVEAWEWFCREQPDVVVTDLVMPNSDGHELLRRIRSCSDVPVIMFSAQGTMAAAVSALKAGADDFVSSLDVSMDDLIGLVCKAASGGVDRPAMDDLSDRLIGDSPAMQNARTKLAGVAPLITPVLVLGESGSGRDAAIQAVHETGSTAGTRLIRFDCADYVPAHGLPDTGAVYLDRIDRLSAPAQDYLSGRLREFQRRDYESSPRVLASAAPIFRLDQTTDFDAYLRGSLVRFPVELPPLRERVDDIPATADYLVTRLAESMNRRIELSESAREYLKGRTWQRNVKQLEELLERAVAFSRERYIRRERLVELVADFEDSLESIRKKHSVRERDSLISSLNQTGGNISRTADQMKKSRGAVYRLIDKHGISHSSSR
jgi:DNA-binding NtrC family response regulator